MIKEIYCDRCGFNRVKIESESYGEHQCFDGGVGHFKDYPDKRYKIKKPITPTLTVEQVQAIEAETKRKAIERVNWINEEMTKNVPYWQRLLMNVTKSKYLFKKFDWKIKTYKYSEIGQDVIEIWHNGKLIVGKIFKA